jgi:hypothetical protein
MPKFDEAVRQTPMHAPRVRRSAPPATEIGMPELVRWLSCSATKRSVRARDGALVERRARVLWWRFCAAQPITLKEVGERLGVSPVRARQVERAALDDLRAALCALPEVRANLQDARHALRSAVLGAP